MEPCRRLCMTLEGGKRQGKIEEPTAEARRARAGPFFLAIKNLEEEVP